MDPKIEVVLETSKAGDSRVDFIVESNRLRSGYARYHLISSTEVRERGIFRFHGALEFCSVTLAHMLGLSLRVSWRGNMIDD